MSTNAVPLAEMTIAGFLDELAARVPAPGGGATAALHAAQAAALVGMVARYTTGSRYTEHAGLVADIVERSDLDRARALQLADDDATAFAAVAAAYALPREGPGAKKSRSAAIAAALVSAAAPPAAVIHLVESVMSSAESILPVANRNVITDVAAAAEAARAASTTARLNVEINLGGVREEAIRTDLVAVLERVDPLTERATTIERVVRQTLR